MQSVVISKLKWRVYLLLLLAKSTKVVAVIPFVIAGWLFLLAGCQRPVKCDDCQVLKAKPYGRIANDQINESSGLQLSRRHLGVIWTHNDSYDEARIFAIDRHGQPIGPASSQYGIAIVGAENIDWEDIAIDGKGNLIIADSGNNRNRRRDLSLYMLAEPNPYLDHSAKAFKKILFAYPDQDKFPPDSLNFDCEAIFWADGKLYLLTKHRSDSNTKLYRFDSLEGSSLIKPTLIGQFPIGGRVTGADVTINGQELFILTYDSLWRFERLSETANWFEGNAYRLLLSDLGKSEGITVLEKDRSLIISNEEGDLFEIKISQLKSYTGQEK